MTDYSFLCVHIMWSSSFQTGLNMTPVLLGTLLLGRARVQSTVINHSLKRRNLCNSEISPCEVQLRAVLSATCVLSANAKFQRKVLLQTRQNCYIHLQDVKICFQSRNKSWTGTSDLFSKFKSVNQLLMLSNSDIHPQAKWMKVYHKLNNCSWD